MSMNFRPHGEFHTWLEGRILITEVTGPWNRELVEAWAQHVYPYAKQLSLDGPHVGIAIIHGSMLSPPDAMEALTRAVRYAVTKLNSIGQIIVADRTVEGRDLIEPAYARIYEGLVPYGFFYEFDEARKFAEDLLRAHAAKSGAD